MIAICKNKNTGRISKIIELSNTEYIQTQLSKLHLNDGTYYIEYFVGEINHDTDT